MENKEKQLIDDFIEKYEDNNYFRNKCLYMLDTDEMMNRIDERDCYHEFGDYLLDEFEDYELINYLEKEGYNVSDRKIEDESIVDMIYSICKTLSPRRYLGKEDMKELINDYIDTWIC